jgi:monoamine oxidase
MTRNEFLKICGILGVSLPFQTLLSSCGKEDLFEVNFKGKVLIIGAGAGGLSSGYILHQLGIDFEILEASNTFGGRMKIAPNFTDFQIPLGAEWLETETSIFEEIVNDASVTININTYPDNPDRKFINSSWFNFYEEYILPSIASKINYQTIVENIDYSGNQVVVNTSIGQYTADKIIVSVPLKILQDGDIGFTPSLPQEKASIINSTLIWDGFKAFFEFNEKFYPDEFDFNISPDTDGQKLFYNAALGQNTNKHILGLFVVGKPALDYLPLSNQALRDYILNELDALFGNQATSNYVQHISQNWQNEPFIKGGYMSDYADWRSVKKLSSSVDGKVYFAGGEYTDGEDWVSVHTAAQSAQTAVRELVR